MTTTPATVFLAHMRDTYAEQDADTRERMDVALEAITALAASLDVFTFGEYEARVGLAVLAALHTASHQAVDQRDMNPAHLPAIGYMTADLGVIMVRAMPDRPADDAEPEGPPPLARAQCAICTTTIFGDVAERGTCLGCMPLLDDQLIDGEATAIVPRETDGPAVPADTWIDGDVSPDERWLIQTDRDRHEGTFCWLARGLPRAERLVALGIDPMSCEGAFGSPGRTKTRLRNVARRVERAEAQACSVRADGD